MEQRPRGIIYARLIGWVVICYGLSILATSLLKGLQLHRHSFNRVLLTLPVLFGVGYVYLGTLLLRLKRNAWATAVALSVLTFVVNILVAFDHHSDGIRLHPFDTGLRLGLSLLILLLLLSSQSVFRVRSNRVGFRQAAVLSAVALCLVLLYGVVGFSLLDRHDFHQEISLPTALHQTIDQLGITTPNVVPHTARARLFVDSLTVISVAGLSAAALSFFQPIRFRLQPQHAQRALALELLERYPSDIDDFFKIWPHDKHYFFDHEQQAGLAYQVRSGVALVVGDPFGNPKRFLLLLQAFQELCFVNDWRPAFVHVSSRHRDLYEKLGYRLQQIGEEAVLDLESFQGERNSKYFRQIRNRFTKLNYRVELLEPPFDDALLARLGVISANWLERPGRAERAFMLGSFEPDYMQLSRLAVVRAETGQVCGFMNVVPTFEPQTANYDLLRCDSDAPGNCNDFLLLGLIDLLYEEGVRTLNLGLCPLKGLDESEEVTGLIDSALRFIYANGDRFYSFTGLQRFKSKYRPVWDDRFVAYSGNPASFARVMTALTRAMKVK
jgi:phosphatidylglycerol lysyltransferase